MSGRGDDAHPPPVDIVMRKVKELGPEVFEDLDQLDQALFPEPSETTVMRLSERLIECRQHRQTFLSDT